MSKLTGPIPASLTRLINVPAGNFWLYNSGGLCYLNPDSFGVAARCSGCPYPVCACKWAAAQNTCPSGTDGPVALNPLSPYYPTATYCCANGTGNTMRERLVTALFLDCSAARPCTATAKGLTQTVLSITGKLTGTIPPQIATLAAVTFLTVANDVSGTLPTQLGLMTLVKSAFFGPNGKLDGTIPPQISGMTSATYL
jgi:hypothetical protein